MLYPLFLPSIWATMSKNCIVDEFIAVDENGQLTIWSVDELTLDDLTVDELTVDELTCYPCNIYSIISTGSGYWCW